MVADSTEPPRLISRDSLTCFGLQDDLDLRQRQLDPFMDNQVPSIVEDGACCIACDYYQHAMQFV